MVAKTVAARIGFACLLLAACLSAVTRPVSAEVAHQCQPERNESLPCSVTYRAVDGTELAVITLLSYHNEVSDGEYPPRLSLRIENTGTEPLSVEPSQFLDVNTFDGEQFLGSPESADTAKYAPLLATELQPGEAVEGNVWFPDSHGTWCFFYRPETNRLIPLAIHAVGGGGAGLRPVNRLGRGRG